MWFVQTIASFGAVQGYVDVYLIVKNRRASTSDARLIIMIWYKK